LGQHGGYPKVRNRGIIQDILSLKYPYTAPINDIGQNHLNPNLKVDFFIQFSKKIFIIPKHVCIPTGMFILVNIHYFIESSALQGIFSLYIGPRLKHEI
jgi:hypothetical protein